MLGISNIIIIIVSNFCYCSDIVIGIIIIGIITIGIIIGIIIITIIVILIITGISIGHCVDESALCEKLLGNRKIA